MCAEKSLYTSGPIEEASEQSEATNMKSNKTIMDLASVYAKRQGPRTIPIYSRPTTAFYLTWDEIVKIHLNEGIQNMTTIKRRTDQWLSMDDGFCQVMGNYWILGVYTTEDKLILEDYHRSHMNAEIAGITG